MAHYLVVAHQTATSRQLVDRLARVERDDPGARFAILVPATHPKHLVRREEGGGLFVWDDREVQAMAQQRADEARLLLEEEGLRVTGTIVGDESPLLAIEDELRTHPERYEGIVLSTLPAGVSRWVRMDVGAQAQRRFELPLLQVSEGIEDGGWSMSAPDQPSGAPAGRTPPLLGRLTGRQGLAAIAGLALIYLVGAAILALAVDRAFFVNDAIAVAIFAVFFIGLLLGERYAPARRLISGSVEGARRPDEDAISR